MYVVVGSGSERTRSHLVQSRTGDGMSRKETYEEKTEAFLLPILEKDGFSLVDVEYVKEGGQYYLRAYIDKPGGITIDDCVDVSREMNEILDREDYVDGTYTFEVSSPGLGRPIRKERDFARNLDKEVEIKSYRTIDGEKEFLGLLRDYSEADVTIESEEGIRKICREDIALIREAIDLSSF